MRYLTLTIFLAAILGFTGCDMNQSDGGDGDAATDEMGMEEGTMEEGAMEEAAMEEMPMDDSGPPQWATLEQNVMHPE